MPIETDYDFYIMIFSWPELCPECGGGLTRISSKSNITKNDYQCRSCKKIYEIPDNVLHADKGALNEGKYDEYQFIKDKRYKTYETYSEYYRDNVETV